MCQQPWIWGCQTHANPRKRVDQALQDPYLHPIPCSKTPPNSLVRSQPPAMPPIPLSPRGPSFQHPSRDGKTRDPPPENREVGYLRVQKSHTWINNWVPAQGAERLDPQEMLFNCLQQARRQWLPGAVPHIQQHQVTCTR